MIRAVFDANVVAAGIPAEVGTLAILFERWLAGRFSLVLSEFILHEVSITWAKPYWRIRLADDRVKIAFNLLRLRAEVTPITVTVEGIASHPEDDMVLATAVSAGAEYLVSGDKEQQDLRAYGQVKIVSPAAFLAIIDEELDAPTPAPQP